MLKLYNSLTKKIEEFKSIHPLQVGMYTCGPTVYSFAHIGNFRTYTMADVLKRVLEYNGYDVNYIMNLTDVGHLTGDNLGDADLGEDRMEKAAKKEGKTAWEIAEFYADIFKKDFEKLNLENPKKFAKATDHIKEQIDLVKRLEEKGYTYKISDGIYFDTAKFENYGELSNLDQIKAGARVEINPEKKNQRDFALWKFSYPDGVTYKEYLAKSGKSPEEVSKRQMEWKSPWGIGFPGWHIECSAMSLKNLGETFDIHGGGPDLKFPHHENERAQSEAATGKTFVNYWMHVGYVQIEKEKMAKSLGNFVTIREFLQHYHPEVLRYFSISSHYRSPVDYTGDHIDFAFRALERLYTALRGITIPHSVSIPSHSEYEKRFCDAMNDDFNTPVAIAVLFDLAREINRLRDADSEEVYPLALLLKKLGNLLGILNATPEEFLQNLNGSEIDRNEIDRLISERLIAKTAKDWKKADEIRETLLQKNIILEDSPDGKTKWSVKAR